ncbi:MAG: gamma-glutamyltransferase family protein [Christensenellales bacterium]|jgi:gamma-glutamyltranspeptidase/glutathione hydrolase
MPNTLPFDPAFLPYPGTRYPICASRGMVNTSSPQAASAGLQILLQGGNAVDAAVAAATALTVVEPTANGIGSDAFALVWIEKDKKLYGLNASGWTPEKLTLEAARKAADGDQMPCHGWLPVMVPGAPAAWAALAGRFGKLSLETSMAPAVSYAREGYPVSPCLAQMWRRVAKNYESALKGEAFSEWFRTFLPEGKAPCCGQMITLPRHGDTLEEIAATRGESFYRGALADKILADSQAFGGFFTHADFADYQPEWVEPATLNYRGYTVCEIPPNGQGIVALMALNILQNFAFTQKESSLTFHRQWEAMKIAFADGKRYITDQKAMELPWQQLLDPAYGAARAKEISDLAALPGPGQPHGSGTVYLCTADGEGNMVSYIQSNYMDFGSGIVVRDTGIALQNRGHDFSLNPADANCIAPRKKSYHTIIPGFLLKDGKAVGPFGVMGGYMQPQGHVQVVMNLVDFGLNPQQALDAPRWQWMKDKAFAVETGFSPAILKQLQAKGHEVTISADSPLFGRGQMIWKMPDGCLMGATEGRTDSNIACY